MRLTLVMPTGLQVGYDDYFSSEPLGIETLASHAKAHADVVLHDMRGKGHDVEAHAQAIMADKPDLIGVSLNAAPHTTYVFALAKAIRRIRGDAKIILGGQQVTFLTQEALATGDVNAVVRGEGELTLTEILAGGGQYRGVAGVSWSDNGTIHDEPDRPQIENIDSTLLPSRALLEDRHRYRMGEYRVEGIESSRGCPFQCNFCSVRNFHRGKWRPKSVDRVMQEVDAIQAMYSYPKIIYFADDNFAHDIERVRGICKAIIQRKSKDYFWCQARADKLAANPDVVELMGQAHFAAVLVGIETPVARLLKSSRKGTNLEQISKAIELLHKQDVGVWGTFTLGLPGETPEESAVSAEFIPTAKVDVCQITVATPIPGSQLYEDAKKNGDILITDWDKYDFTTPTMKGQLSKEQMDAHMHKAYLKTYMSMRFLLSMFSKRTNLQRLRRTAFGVFWKFIWFLLKQRLGMLLGRKADSGLPPAKR